MRLYGIRYEAKGKNRKIREDSSSSLEGLSRQSKGRLRTPKGDPSHLPLLDPTPNKGETARRPTAFTEKILDIFDADNLKPTKTPWPSRYTIPYD
ncbi:hypothetical protein L249_4365 [Ophiocordyceps polyrhachis-furcata BCC 54312]|uniref:Uncharacterized protein n=1 Tax=Ophiocordyceps polyrhachis-furcata BCC 54312 TaxID=1330021 RepID=A0A367L7D3_9HYPO|nr:hypothetical protein L249_4365 [Ophiocordyceps polyrhachis-furcata BCC 54312]